MKYQIEVNNVRSQITPRLDNNILGKLNIKLSYELPGAMFMQSRNPWAGVRYLFSKQTQTFPTGLIHLVDQVLQNENIDYDVLDKRAPVFLGQELPIYGFTFRDYQQEAVNRAVSKQRGILKLGTGAGKTNILIGIVAKLNIPTLILIHKTDIFYQLVERFEKALQIPIGKVGDGYCDIQKVTIGMIQTISRVYDVKKKRIKGDPDQDIVVSKVDQIKNLVEDTQALICDEAQHSPADSFWNVYKKAKNAFYRIGVSASPWRENNDDLLIEAGHAKQLIDVSASTLIERGYLVPPIVYLFELTHERKTRSGVRYPDIYDDEVVNNQIRNQIIVQIALQAASQNKVVLIAVTKIEHGKILEAMLQEIEPDSLFVFGESDSQLRQQVLKELDQHKRKIVISTTIFGEGIDCPGLDVLINAKAGSSSVDAFQLLGRVLRPAPNKERAYVVDIFDQGCKYLGAHAKSRLRIYQTEPKYELKEVNSIGQLEFK